MTIGRHIIAELYGCNPLQIDSEELLMDIARSAAIHAGATIIKTDSHAFSPHGITGMVLVQESHLAFHSWPEHGYLAVDFFTCGTVVDPGKGIDVFESRLSPMVVERRLVERGTKVGSYAESKGSKHTSSACKNLEGQLSSFARSGEIRGPT